MYFLKENPVFRIVALPIGILARSQGYRAGGYCVGFPSLNEELQARCHQQRDQEY